MVWWTASSFAAFAGDAAGEATFSWVSYAGHDPAEASFPAAAGEYRNPIIPGFQPDPSIVRVGDDFYLTNSSFAFFPGLPVFQSRDLVNWVQIGNAIDRSSQFDFSRLGIARGIFAATLRWHEGVFYIVGTCVDCGSTFILHALNPSGPWSDPIWLPSVDGVDPDLFFDTDGTAWIANNGPPSGAPAYDGHRAIWLQALDLDHWAMRGPRTVIVNGGVDFAKHPIWIEGPHLIKKDRWYYLIAAEGGTAAGHSEVVFRSRHVRGPYHAAPLNPILTQRDLDDSRPFPIAAAGHADFVQLENGEWWSVFLATRPYRANLSNLGRETFLLPVTWAAAWPVILQPRTAVPHVGSRPPLSSSIKVDRSHFHDAFGDQRLRPDWEMLRTPREQWYRLTGNALAMDPRSESISGDGNPSFLGIRQRHANMTFETELHYQPLTDGDQAGLVAFADERHHYFLGLQHTLRGNRVVVAVRNGIDDPAEGRIIADTPYSGGRDDALRLRIDSRGDAYDFSYAVGSNPWVSLLANGDGTLLASEPTNQFTGALIGVYAVSGGRRQSVAAQTARPAEELPLGGEPKKNLVQ